MAYGQLDGSGSWRARYKRPDGTWGSKSGFSSETAAENWGAEQEALIRRRMWIDPRNAEMPFADFVEEWFDAVSSRLEPNTRTKYRSHIDRQLVPEWGDWPMIGIFNGYIEIEKWVSDLHEDYAELSVASFFATFSTIMNAAVRAKVIPANPCYGVRVTSGEYDHHRLVATPVQVLRAAMRLYESDMGLSGFTLCLVGAYTGARWSEIVGQERHEYREADHALEIRFPLKEVNGKLLKAGVEASQDAPTFARDVTSATRGRRSVKRGRTKTPAGTRYVALPPSVAVIYETLLDSHRYPFVFTSPEGALLRRTNFRERFWRPAWDGRKPDQPGAVDHVPAILPWFTFREARHTHATWMIEDGVPEVARRARLGQKMKGIARVYDHVTSVMLAQIREGLEARWLGSLLGLSPEEQERIIGWFPHLRATVDGVRALPSDRHLAISSPLILHNTQEARPRDRGPGF